VADVQHSLARVACKVLAPDQNKVLQLSLPAIAAELSGFAERFSYSAASRQISTHSPLGALTGEIFVIRHVVHSVKLDQRNSFFGVDGRADLWIGGGCL
jgi:hypothetical protein